MRALADPIGERVIDEARFENRLDDRAERVVNDTVTERRRRNDASLRIVDFEGGVAARPIVACAKLALQSEQLALQIGEERSRPRLLAFSFDGATGSRVQCLKVGNPSEQLVMPSWHRR